MPRELYLVSPRAMTLVDLVEAASAVDGSLVLRALSEGGSLQLVDAEAVAVITVDVSRQVLDPVGVEAVLDAPAVDMLPPGERWWTQATAPWGPHGVLGVRVFDELSVLLGSSVGLVEDGERRSAAHEAGGWTERDDDRGRPAEHLDGPIATDLARAVPTSDIAHPLIDQAGSTGDRRWSMTETRARVVSLDGWRLDLLRRAAEHDREVVLATDEGSALTPAFAQVWSESGGHWLVRDPEGGLRDGFSGRALTGIDDLWSDTSDPGADARGPAPRHVWLGGTDALETDALETDALELSAVVSTRLPARTGSLLGGAVTELAAAVGTTPTAWGSKEPVLRPWDPSALTAAVRSRMPGPVQLVVRGPGLAAVIRVRRTRHGLEETTHATLAAVGGDDDLGAEVASRASAALAHLAGTSMPVVGLVFARGGHHDLLRRPVLQLPAMPLALLVGAPVVRALRLDPAAESDRSGAQPVGRAKLPSLLYRLQSGELDLAASWHALQHVLLGFDPAARPDVFATALAAVDLNRPG